MKCTCEFKNTPNAKFCGSCGLELAEGQGSDATGPRNAAAFPSVGDRSSAHRRSRAGIPLAVALIAVFTAGYWWLHRPAHSSPSLPETNQAVQPEAFRGEAYRSLDGRTVITVISKDELEIAKDGVNLVCKYTKQDGVVRAVVNTLGTTQAVYYRTTSEGLQDAEGQIFYAPAAFAAIEKVVKDFLGASAAADAERAYECFAPELKQVQSFDAFRTMLAANPSLFDVVDVNFTKRSGASGLMTFIGAVKIRNGGELPCDFTLRQYDNGWKLVGWHIGTHE